MRAGAGSACLLFVLASFASANIVSSSRSNWQRGTHLGAKRASVSPAFQNLCELPAGTTTVSPGPATISFPSSLNATVPTRSQSARSGWVHVRRRDEAVRLDVTSPGLTRPRSPASLQEEEALAVTGFSITFHLADHLFLSIVCREISATESLPRRRPRRRPGKRSCITRTSIFPIVASPLEDDGASSASPPERARAARRPPSRYPSRVPLSLVLESLDTFSRAARRAGAIAASTPR